MKKILLMTLLSMTTLCFAIDKTMELLISSEQIAAKVSEVAAQINKDYKDKQLTLVMVMKGSLCITTDLIRQINVPCHLEYVRASSYGQNGMKAGELIVTGLDRLDIKGRDLLVIDDIFETGNTIVNVVSQLNEKQPNSIKTLLLLVKDVPRKTNYRPDYVLFNIPDRFVIGYGLDYKELYRGLPDICAFINDTPPF